MNEFVKELREAEKRAKEICTNPYRFVPYYGKAADAIEELIKREADMTHNMAALSLKVLRAEEKLPRWIPGTERLIHSGWYLVACNEWGGSAVRKAIYDEATRKWLEFPCGGPKDITEFVTHYMPLPEPPKEE